MIGFEIIVFKRNLVYFEGNFLFLRCNLGLVKQNFLDFYCFCRILCIYFALFEGFRRVLIQVHFKVILGHVVLAYQDSNIDFIKFGVYLANFKHFLRNFLCFFLLFLFLFRKVLYLFLGFKSTYFLKVETFSILFHYFLVPTLYNYNYNNINRRNDYL